jgi:hemolysin activation/secretion protein
VFPRILPATPLRATRVSLFADRATALSLFGTEVRATGELRYSHLSTDDASTPVGASLTWRASTVINIERPFDRGRLALQTIAGAVGANGGIPPQELLYFGGPVSAPGYAFHELATSAGASQRLEWRMPIPAPSIPLGRFGRVPGQATLAPFVQGTFMRSSSFDGFAHATGVYPSVGVAIQPFYDLLRLQVGKGLRNGRWTFDVDVSKEFWGVL